jgi:hypothetical protein
MPIFLVTVKSNARQWSRSSRTRYQTPVEFLPIVGTRIQVEFVRDAPARLAAQVRSLIAASFHHRQHGLGQRG